MPSGQFRPVQVCDRLRGGQADAETAGFLVAGAVRPVKTVEDPAQIRNLGDGVGDTQTDAAVFRTERDLDFSIFRTVLYCVIR